MTVTQQDVERVLRELDIGEASRVLVHSSFKSIGRVEGGPATVVRGLVNAAATVMMPAFTSARTFIWDERADFEGNAYAPQSEWPPDRTPEPYTYDTRANETMGIIVETFRTLYPVERTPHPSASFIALGDVAADVTGPGTEVDGVEPIRRLMDAGGDVLLLGVTHSNSTAIHLAEKLAGRTLFVRYALTPDGVRAAEGGGCGAAFDGLQPHVQELERRAVLGNATLSAYALQPYVAAARAMIERDPYALLCETCVRCKAHRSRVVA